MQYVGGKFKIAKHILPIILAERKPGQPYAEPFVGGANVICRVPPEQGPRIGADINFYVIALLKALQKNWQPPKFVSHKTFLLAKENPKKLDPALAAFVAMAPTYLHRWFGAFQKIDLEKSTRILTLEFRKNLLMQTPLLKGINFQVSRYEDFEIPKKSLVYCDPPYRGTAHDYLEDFDHDKFWIWAEKQATKHKIFISEYDAPKGWKCAWEKSVSISLSNYSAGSVKSRVERLFTK